MADLDIVERRKPQDGKIDFKKYGGPDIELRVATIPTQGGVEDVVMRILDAGDPTNLTLLDQVDMTVYGSGANSVDNVTPSPSRKTSIRWIAVSWTRKRSIS